MRQAQGVASPGGGGLGVGQAWGGGEGATLFRGACGTFHSSWESEAWLWEMGPGDQVDFMSDSLPARESHGRG